MFPVSKLTGCLFRYRRPVVLAFAVITLLMLAFTSQLRIDAGYQKQIPLQHPYMQVFGKYVDTFGGADRVLVVLLARDGDMFTPAFFHDLQVATDRVFFMPGVDRAQVRSLFTPNVRYTEVIEGGLRAGNVIPSDFAYRPDDLKQVKDNILKADVVGSLVASDFSGALVSARVQEIDPNTGEKVDYLEVAAYLESEVRQVLGGPGGNVDVHIIGFAPLVGEIVDGAYQVAAFFVIALLVTFLLVVCYAGSWRLALLPTGCSLIAVIWQLGSLSLLGMGLDPMSMLVPFLIFAIGVSHGIQMLSDYRASLSAGLDQRQASEQTLQRLLLPGSIALVTDTIGFITILAIDVGVIREMALTASLGVAIIILTNLLLLPLLLGHVTVPADYPQHLQNRAQRWTGFWRGLAGVTDRRPAQVIVLISLLLLGYGVYAGSQVHIGDRQAGVPELRHDARYNQDSRIIADRFAIGVDTLLVFAETRAQGCTDYEIMQALDTFAWRVRNHSRVQSVQTLPHTVRHIHAGLNEGSLQWFTLPRHPAVMAQAVSHVPTASGLLNTDCSVMPIVIHTADHRAETIDSIISTIEQAAAMQTDSPIDYRLAGGNVGVMAATNQEVAESQFPLLVYVYTAVSLLCWLYFRSLRVTFAIVVPLVLTSLLAYALMSHLGIGLKVNTLPIVALGVGIGVDYGIYIYSRLRACLLQGLSLSEAYFRTLATTGAAVLVTALTLSAGLLTWICSPLQFQVDMGMLLVYMFLLSMFGAVLLLPALISLLHGQAYVGKTDAMSDSNLIR